MFGIFIYPSLTSTLENIVIHQTQHSRRPQPGPRWSLQTALQVSANNMRGNGLNMSAQQPKRNTGWWVPIQTVFPIVCWPINLQGQARTRLPLLPTPPPQTQTAGPPPPQTRCIADVPTARQPYREPSERHDLGQMDKTCPGCGALHWLMECSTTSGSSKSWPLFSMCCGNGDIQLPAAPPPPEQLLYFFTASTLEASRFCEKIHQYNAALTFTSLGVKVDGTVNTGGGGPPTFCVHGELHHQLGSLLPRNGERPVYAQLYIYDPRLALKHQMHCNVGLNQHIMQHLQDLILENHHWATTFKNAFQVFEHTHCWDVSIQLTTNQNHDPHCFNLPTSDEVAAIIPGDGTQSYGYCDVVVHLQGDHSDTSVMDLLCMSVSNIHSSTYTERMDTITSFRCPPLKKADSHKPIILHTVSSASQVSSHCYSILAASFNNSWSTCGLQPIRTASTTLAPIKKTYEPHYIPALQTPSPMTWILVTLANGLSFRLHTPVVHDTWSSAFKTPSHWPVTTKPLTSSSQWPVTQLGQR